MARLLSIGKKNPCKPTAIRDKYLPHFVEQNEKWCKATATSYLAKKNKTWDRHKDEWLFREAPYAIDLLGLVIWVRCYHLKVAVFYEYSMWTTQRVQDIDKCNLFLLYRGNKIFDDTRLIRTAEYRETK